MSIVALYLLLLKATVTSFAGMGSLPQIRQDFVVTHGVITDEQLSQAVVIGRSAPGPVGAYVVAIGYFAGGWSGAIVSGDLDPRDSTAALGFVNAMTDLPDVTTKGGMLYVFRLP